MEAIEKIVEQLNQQAELEQLQLKEKETNRIDQEFQAELSEIEIEHQKRLEKSLKNLEINYKQGTNCSKTNDFKSKTSDIGTCLQ